MALSRQRPDHHTTPRLVDTLLRWSGNRWRPLATEARTTLAAAAAFDSRRQVGAVWWRRPRDAVRDTATPGSGTASGGRSAISRRPAIATPRDGVTTKPGQGRDFRRRAIGDGPVPLTPWTFDGSRWERADITTGPPTGLVHHAMAYDSLRQRVVMFGGFDFANRRCVGECGNGTAARGSGSRRRDRPRRRCSHLRMAYDCRTRSDGGVRWRPDGRDVDVGWLKRGRSYPPSGPSALVWQPWRTTRAAARILFGGSGRGAVCPVQTMNDCWEWDGMQWVRSGA